MLTSRSTLDPYGIENRITPRTRAIMPVHTSGVAAEMDTIMDIARRHDVPVIEDCAQSAGASYKGKFIGAWGDVGAFSLQVNKIITAGEGWDRDDKQSRDVRARRALSRPRQLPLWAYVGGNQRAGRHPWAI